MMTIKKILIVGGGLSGGMVRYFLAKMLSNFDNLPYNIMYEIWEKDSHIGGRMKGLDFHCNNQEYRIDMGAQYITSNKECDDLIEDLVEELILIPFPGKIEGMNTDRSNALNYISPRGLDKLIEHYAGDSFLHFSRELSSLSFDSNSQKWTALCQNNISDEYDGVVLTIPAPNILQLQGNFTSLVPASFIQQLHRTQYSSRFALSLLISHLPASAVPWTSKYVKGDDVIRYISIENKKRQLNNDNNPNCLAILVHTSIQFYEEFYLHSDQDITEKILEHLYPYLPMLRSENIVLQNSSLHHWKLSQVITSSQSMDNIDGGRILNDQSCDSSLFLKQSNHQSTQLEFPFLGFAGDYFTESNFNGCSKSARSLVRKILAT